MESKVKLAGQPFHPTLIVFRLGLFVTATVFDLIYMITGTRCSVTRPTGWPSRASSAG